MNMLTVSRKLREMALKQKRFSVSQAFGIIDAIMNYYCVTSGFYEEDCIRVFQKLIDTGTLQLA